jgi:hypothetical protein
MFDRLTNFVAKHVRRRREGSALGIGMASLKHF